MPSWLLIVIVVVVVSIIWISLMGAMLIKFGKTLSVKNTLIRELNKQNYEKAQIINAYGFKEIEIKGDN